MEYFTAGLIEPLKRQSASVCIAGNDIRHFCSHARVIERNIFEYFRIIPENLCPAQGMIMYSITILIETNWSRGHEPGQALPLNLCDKRSSFIEIIYYSTAPRR